MANATLMAAETREIPERVHGQRTALRGAHEAAGLALGALDPALVATLGRGSSAHAATWFRAVVELAAGVPTAPLSMSVASVYGRSLRLAGAACVGVSQSGSSADFLAALDAADGGGAARLVATNDPAAPALDRGATPLPIGAGPERAVSATKSFACSLVALGAAVAAWREDAALADALDALAPALDEALALDWTEALAPLGAARAIYTVGRGPSLGIAAEAALKLVETCEIPTQAWSAAELLHGPLQLAGPGLAALVFASDDEGRESVELAIDRLADAGAAVVVADPCARLIGTGGTGGAVPVARTAHRWLDGVSQITSFYRAVEALSRARGLDPDRPSRLAKVTRTL